MPISIEYTADVFWTWEKRWTTAGTEGSGEVLLRPHRQQSPDEGKLVLDTADDVISMLKNDKDFWGERVWIRTVGSYLGRYLGRYNGFGRSWRHKFCCFSSCDHTCWFITQVEWQLQTRCVPLQITCLRAWIRFMKFNEQKGPSGDCDGATQPKG